MRSLVRVPNFAISLAVFFFPFYVSTVQTDLCAHTILIAFAPLDFDLLQFSSHSEFPDLFGSRVERGQALTELKKSPEFGEGGTGSTWVLAVLQGDMDGMWKDVGQRGNIHRRRGRGATRSRVSSLGVASVRRGYNYFSLLNS